ncbi:MAG: aldo/keto reductase, partial [Stackebrandtia sp.]
MSADAAGYGLGTWTWGRDTDPDTAARQLEVYLDAGGTVLDTAPTYGDGHAEEYIGALVSRRYRRDAVKL